MDQFVTGDSWTIDQTLAAFTWLPLLGCLALAGGRPEPSNVPCSGRDFMSVFTMVFFMHADRHPPSNNIGTVSGRYQRFL